MAFLFSKYGRLFCIPPLFLLAFGLIALVYIERSDATDHKHFHNHAIIIADDVWALNQNGAEAYLELAVKANHYRSLNVSIPGDDGFLAIASAPLTGISRLLYDMHLIGVKKLSEDIFHDDQIIGTLSGEKYIRVIYPLVNILIFLLLLLLTTIFVAHLFVNRNYLEQQVRDRTNNLLKSQQRFHDLVNLLPEMVLETDLNGIILYANQAARERLADNDNHIEAVNFLDFIMEDNRHTAKEEFRESLKGEKSNLNEFTILSNKKKPFPVLIRSAPITDGGNIIGARMIVVDISERRKMEEQLHRDQKMKAIGLMAGGVAHDLNNILSGIISYPELLLMDLDEDSKLRRPLEAIRRSGIDASEVVADLLTVARGVAPSREIINLNSLIREYLNSPDFGQLLGGNKLMKLSTSFADNLGNISCSPIHVRKCLMNLATNGVEAIKGKGTLSITTANHTQSTSSPEDSAGLPTGDYATVMVHDSGTGISQNEIEHIFEPFYTKKVMGRSGTGLGLAVVWNTMRDHGGTVHVESNGNGTTFTLYFPSIEEHVSTVAGHSDWRTLRGKGERILIIDDEQRQRDIASELLLSLNYQVDTVASGEAAVEYLQENSADLLILDMIMSPGQNGRVTYEQILQFRPGQKAIIASGFAEDDDVRATLALGAHFFVAKPYTIDQLGSAIYNALNA